MSLFFIGMVMGLCDLIPGISGGTVAYTTGIYDDLLLAIQSLNLLEWKKVKWRFLLTLGGGVAISVLLFARLIFWLLMHHCALLYALFFGAILATATPSLKKPNGMILLGFLFSFALCSLPQSEVLQISPFWLFISGMLGALAMLLPGISGSFMLHILGVYSLFISSIVHLDFRFLFIIALGISTGLMLFSRFISKMLALHPERAHHFLIGCMLGGLKTLWPYGDGNFLSVTCLMLFGFLIAFFLERKAPRLVR